MQMWQIVANLEFVTGFAINLQTRKPNISPRDGYSFSRVANEQTIEQILNRLVKRLYNPLTY